MEHSIQNRLTNQSVKKVFFQYLFPTIVGMIFMSINIVIDGIFVGNGIGSIALASVNIAVPVFSIILAISLWIGTGGGALYSMALGENNKQFARKIFSFSIVIIILITLIIGFVCFFNVENLSYALGANEDTIKYVIDYLSVLLLFGVFMAIENALSVFVRNDGNPQLAMVSLIVTALANILLNYLMIYILQLEVKGAAIATVSSGGIGMVVLLTHFFKKDRTLKFIPFQWSLNMINRIISIGFPSFLAEAGMLVFVIGYNLMAVKLAGTNGVAAFSVINYLHSFIFLAFIGIGSSIQPMISYYYGAKLIERIQETIKIAEKMSFLLGVLVFVLGFVATNVLVSLFGISSTEIKTLATEGLRLFFTSYLFMGINFTYTTYFQSIGQIKPAVGIIIMRQFILLIVALWILPQLIGVHGIWLSVPVVEMLVVIFLMAFRGKIFEGLKKLRRHN
ncbi:MATE family efflux transporter [Fervidibacillus halotolerans]|uniref:Multidrug export protein MepA n=1 Tax=Fervidibacillus halotolerans TaxID=2980027 RepID=A0A9E8RZN1_9BACI|nr:MATE family efflux transporter [Fervidibacillus halotolerans]WAA13319.1 MATE family efflux transporter [Fervidibacillus halotolerans]